LEVLRQRDVTLLTLSYFFALTGGYGVAFWLPTIIERLSGQNNFNVTACVFAVSCRIPRAAVERLAFRSNLRAAMARGDPIIFCGVFLLLAVGFGSNPTACVGLFTLVGARYFAYHPCFWAVPTPFLTESAAAASIGLINSLGNLGGSVGPAMMGYLVSRTHSFDAGLL
jgi:MFS transporter, ACS family, tartrate transporter